MSLDTIQFSLFDYFMDDEKFTLKEATELVKVNKNMQVNVQIYFLSPQDQVHKTSFFLYFYYLIAPQEHLNPAGTCSS